MNDLYCPQCRNIVVPREINTLEINTNEGITRCGHCGKVFRSDTLYAVPLPRNITVSSQGDDLLIVRRWFNPLWLLCIVVCIVWFITGITYYAEIFIPTDSMALNGMRALVFFVIPILGVYAGLAYLINHTEIRVNRRQIAVRHSPVPLTPHKVVDVASIDQIYCKVEKEDVIDEEDAYGVYMVVKGGRRRPLITDLPEMAQAQFIEQVIEHHLGMTDRSVDDEIES